MQRFSCAQIARPILLFVLLVLCRPGGANEGDMAGPDVLGEYVRRHQVAHEAENLTLKLTDRDGNEEVRSMRRYSRLDHRSQYRHLVVFDAPENIAGTALLVHQHAAMPDEQWVYLPGLDQLEKRKSGTRGARRYFMGTDLTYEDISAEDLSRFDYERMPDQILDGVDLFVVRAVPGSNEVARASGYLHRDLFLRKDTYLLVRIDYFDGRGRLSKQMRSVSDPVLVAGQAWRANHVLVENFLARHRTELIVEQRDISSASVPEPMFEPEYLMKRGHMTRQ